MQTEPCRLGHFVDLFDRGVPDLPVALTGEAVAAFLVEHALDDLGVGVDRRSRKHALVVDERALGLTVALVCVWRKQSLVVTIVTAAFVTAIARSV